LSPLLAWVVAAAATAVLVPVAIALARAFGFLDSPTPGYKQHSRPTPYLGGLAVLAGFAVGTLVDGGLGGRFGVLAACAGGLWLVGTVDDRIPVLPGWRVVAEVAAALVLNATGHGWSVFGWDPANLLLTVVWVVGLVNAFNLMDNLDGATGTVAAVSAAGIGGVGLANGDPGLATVAFALCGACLAFLAYNLAEPARIFLGDGGSMPIGLLLAGLAIVAGEQGGLGAASVLLGALLTGLVILDTSLVVVSRLRASVPVVTAGRDHMTHRLLIRLGSPRRVALALGFGQALLAGLAVAASQSGPALVVGVSVGSVVAGLVALFVLESDLWRPPRPAPAPPGRRPAPRRDRYAPAAPADAG
jgi:UDP-GlcNAc:undecaprenyl-phosphate/decaprenyl-phosphate GlcNAc-1-phosphate transferase